MTENKSDEYDSDPFADNPQIVDVQKKVRSDLLRMSVIFVLLVVILAAVVLFGPLISLVFKGIPC
jgi:hypothetical protein